VTYDSVGRTRSWNCWWFRHDAEGRLTEACKDSGCATSGERVEFTYDGEGRRTEIKTSPANGTFTTLELRYQGGSVVEEWTNGTLTRSYTVDEVGTILKMTIPSGQTGAGTYLVSWNGHGDALALHRQNGDGTLTLANSYTYSTWGAPTTTTHNSIADLGLRYLYVGQLGVQWDNFSGLSLHYMQARHYAPAIGRSSSPIRAGSRSTTTPMRQTTR
jgi:YD repeat-containing protein